MTTSLLQSADRKIVRLGYILAASHSGSTLLSMLLGAHPQIATVGEMKLSPRAMGDIHRYRCSCGRLILECDFWRQIQAGMAARAVPFDLAGAGTDYRAVESRYARRLLDSVYRGRFLEGLRDAALGVSVIWRRQLPEIHRRNAALAAVVSELADARVIVDSSKVASRLKYLLRNPGLDVKIIRLIRDGRAVALTYMDPARFADAQDPTRRAGGMGGNRQNERLSMVRAAHQWRRCNEEAENILRCLPPSQWIEVRYEDYCTAPEATVSRLEQFLGVEPDRQPPEFRSVQQHVIGNGMRLDTTSEIRLDQRWWTELTERDLRVFENIAGKMNRRYGYE